MMTVPGLFSFCFARRRGQETGLGQRRKRKKRSGNGTPDNRSRQPRARGKRLAIRWSEGVLSLECDSLTASSIRMFPLPRRLHPE
jgi:hypothetical protein